MNKNYRWKLSSVLFAALSVLWVALAWDGSHFALIALGVTAIILCGFVALTGTGWSTALDGWKRSTDNWSATQKWAFNQDEVLRDTLEELREYDEEAAVIHLGRRIDNNADYMALMHKEAERLVK